MNLFWIIAVFILLLIYIISPIDGLPDFIPFFGWLDDTFLLGLFIYYLRNGRLPGFLSFINRFLFKKKGTGPSRDTGTSGQAKNSGGRVNDEGNTAKDPYAVLGIKPGASAKEIHAAYREAVRKYHPDKVSHLGDEFRELANAKFVEIQSAYDFLIKKTP